MTKGAGSPIEPAPFIEAVESGSRRLRDLFDRLVAD